MNVEAMTVSELKKELKSRGLKVGGKKADLKARLSEALTVDSISPTDTDAEQQQTDFADFENYINDEYNKINAQNDGDDDAHAVTIDDIINKETAAETETETAAVDVEDEEKQSVYAADFDLNAPSEATATNDGAEADTETVTAPDFSEEDSAALNSRSKVQSRHERFGNAPIDEAAKVESRKRRFAAMAAEDGADTTGEGGANKKARVEADPAVERQRILERSQKFGTKLPTDFKLTSEEAALVHSEQIKRAERFGTQHLLPKQIKRAEFDAKRAERMKRFQTGDGTETETETQKAPAKASNKIIAASPDKDSTKMAERRLRFGTTAAVETAKKPQQQPQNKNEKEQNNGKGKKLGGNRKDRNAKKFEQFRQYKKNNRNNGGRGGGRGNGRIRSRGGGGGRNRSRSNGRGGNSNNRRNNNRNGNGNGNANRQQQKQKQKQQSQVQFNAADRAKMEERKLRFSGGQ